MWLLPECLPECVWTAPLMGSQRYRWLCDYISHRDSYWGDSETFDREMRRVAGRILRSMDPAHDDPADVKTLAGAVGCGTRYSLFLVCDVALAIPDGAHEAYWAVLRALINHVQFDLPRSRCVIPARRDAVVKKMMAIINAPPPSDAASSESRLARGEDKIEGAFACAVDLVEALVSVLAGRRRTTHGWSDDGDLRAIAPLSPGARARILAIQKVNMMFTGGRLAVRDLGCVYKDAYEAQRAEEKAASASALALSSDSS